MFRKKRRMISSGCSDGGAGGSGSVPSRRTLCSSLGAGVSGPCESCALALDAPAAPAKTANNAKYLAIRQPRAPVAAADRRGRLCVNLEITSAKAFIIDLDALQQTRSRPDSPHTIELTAKSASTSNVRRACAYALCYNLPLCERAQTSQALHRLRDRAKIGRAHV